MMTIEGEFWQVEVTEAELAEWDRYAEKHGRLLDSLGTEAVLRMFLTHLRRGVNLNEPLA